MDSLYFFQYPDGSKRKSSGSSLSKVIHLNYPAPSVFILTLNYRGVSNGNKLHRVHTYTHTYGLYIYTWSIYTKYTQRIELNLKFVFKIMKISNRDNPYVLILSSN